MSICNEIIRQTLQEWILALLCLDQCHRSAGGKRAVLHDVSFGPTIFTIDKNLVHYSWLWSSTVFTTTLLNQRCRCHCVCMYIGFLLYDYLYVLCHDDVMTRKSAPRMAGSLWRESTANRNFQSLSCRHELAVWYSPFIPDFKFHAVCLTLPLLIPFKWYKVHWNNVFLIKQNGL